MKRTIHFFIITIFSILLIFQMSGCYSKEDIEELKAMYDKSLDYYVNKYNLENITIENYCILSQSNGGPVPTVYVSAMEYDMSDGTTVLWLPDKKIFTDNRQSDEITSDYKSNIINPIVEKYEKEFNVEIKLNYDISFGDYNFNNKCYINKKYDGDINNFVKNNKIEILNNENILFLCNKSETNKVNINAFANDLKEKFSSKFSVLAINSKCVQNFKEIKCDNIYNYVYEDGCYGAYDFYTDDEGKWHGDWYQENFIEAAPSFFISYNNPNYQLKKGDIIFKETNDITAKEMQNALDKYYSNLPELTKENSDYYIVDNKNRIGHKIINIQSPIYKMKFSNRLLENLDTNYSFTFKPDYKNYYEKFGNSKLCMYTYHKINNAYNCDVSFDDSWVSYMEYKSSIGTLNFDYLLDNKDSDIVRYYYFGNYKIEGILDN